jgi:hypothetical protein
VCDLETSRIGAPYIYIDDISNLRVKKSSFSSSCMQFLYVSVIPECLNMAAIAKDYYISLCCNFVVNFADKRKILPTLEM